MRIESAPLGNHRVLGGLLAAAFLLWAPCLQARSKMVAAPKKTVGDLLKQVDTQAKERGNVSIEKESLLYRKSRRRHPLLAVCGL